MYIAEVVGYAVTEGLLRAQCGMGEVDSGLRYYFLSGTGPLELQDARTCR